MVVGQTAVWTAAPWARLEERRTRGAPRGPRLRRSRSARSTRLRR